MNEYEKQLTEQPHEYILERVRSTMPTNIADSDKKWIEELCIWAYTIGENRKNMIGN